jgi:hypothetical protein
MKTLRDLQTQLSAPFSLSAHQIKPVDVQPPRARVLAIVDPHEYEQRLDELVGPEGWTVEYRPLSENAVFCRLTMLGIFKEQVGEEYEAPQRACLATVQAFTRACAAFGLGRYLYSLPPTWAAFDGKSFAEPAEHLLRESLKLAGLLPVMRLERLLQKAKTVQALNEASSLIVAATERGDLFEAERSQLRTLYKKRCEVLLPKKRNTTELSAEVPCPAPRPNPYTKQSPSVEKQLPKEESFSTEVQELVALIARASSFSDLEDAYQRYNELPLSAAAELALRKAFEAREAELNEHA